jgi:hypothetical protein
MLARANKSRWKLLHIVKEECWHILKPNNEASLKSVQSSIQSDGQFIHPVIRLFTATFNSSIYSNPKSVPSSKRTVFFLGGFVFVATVMVAQTQHRDRDFLSGFVFVAATTVAQTQHTEQPLIHPVIRPDCFFWVGLFLWQQQW